MELCQEIGHNVRALDKVRLVREAKFWVADHRIERQISITQSNVCLIWDGIISTHFSKQSHQFFVIGAIWKNHAPFIRVGGAGKIPTSDCVFKSLNKRSPRILKRVIRRTFSLFIDDDIDNAQVRHLREFIKEIPQNRQPLMLRDTR